MTVVTLLPDGRIIARTALTAKGRSTAGEIVPTVVTVSDLKKVEYVLTINLTKTNDAGAAVTPHDISLNQNTVGISVYASAGVTVGGEIIAVGF